MSELVERLRLRAQGRTTETAVLCIDAAHEIERLQQDLNTMMTSRLEQEGIYKEQIERLREDNEKLSRIGIALNRRVANLERDLSVEVAAGHDATERAEAAERERDELRAELSALSGKGEL